MYEQSLGLTHKAFSLTPDSRQYVPIEHHEYCARLLPEAIAQGDGFLLVTGEVGTGKTMLCQRLVDQLEQDLRWQVVWLSNPMLSRQGLLQAICRSLGIEARDKDASELLDTLSLALLDNASSERYLVLIIDEAQALAPETLEALRLLTNLESQTRKLAHVILFAQPEIEVQLKQKAYRQIRQRIVWHHSLTPLKIDEVAQYIQQRLQKAGYFGQPLFSPRINKMIWRQSRGIPRLVNLLADKSLLAMQAEQQQKVKSKHVRAALSATTLHKHARRRRTWLWLLLGLSALTGSFLWLQ